ncbi:MAG: hypothetical protein V1736_04300 [Pseudomonadota bacterium]
MGRRKTWHEKLANDKDLPKVVVITEEMSRKWGEGTLVVPAPLEVDEIMRHVPQGKLITINHIRMILASKHGAGIACPITTGIFARIAAEAAAEDEAHGKREITPFWRTLKSRGELNPKYPGGVEGQKKRLEAEGHRVLPKGKRVVVENYEMHLVGEQLLPDKLV